MSAKRFLEDALGSALELAIATHDDVVRHVTPDVLATHLPRPLWARLLTACLGAPKVDAQLVIETVGVPNLCEHVPSTILWTCLAEVAARALGKPEGASAIPMPMPKQSSSPAKVPLAPAPPPEAPRPRATPPGPIPAQSIPSLTQPEGDSSRGVAAQRFRQTGTGIGGGSRIGQPQARRPQAAAPAPAPVATVPPSRNVVRRGATDLVENETETAVESEWRGKEIAVDDSQLVDWSTETTGGGSRDDDFSDLGRKR
jgi:hypothetical protein